MKLRRLAALTGAMVLTLGVAGAVYADSGNPTNISASVSGHTVTITSDWTWTKCTGTKIVGWAVSWGDPDFTGNPLPKTAGGSDFYYMGDAVQGNTVFTAGTPCSGTSGALGSLSHTYSTSGPKDVCVIVYDMVKTNGSFPASGAHSDKAGGPSRNTDNSVEQNELKGESICLSPEIPIEIPKVPNIHVVKTPSTTTLPAGGGSVTYTYVVTNTGDLPLSNVTLGDDKCNSVSEATGDANTNGMLDLTETWTFTCTATLTATTTNTATAAGHDGETTVSDTDQATVTVAAATPVPATPVPATPVPATPVPATPKPSGGVQGETNVPHTAPPTDALSSTTSDPGNTLPLILIVLGIIGLAAVVLTPGRAKR